VSPITWTHHLVFLSLLLFVPFLAWRTHPAAALVLLVGVIVALVDPLGAGDADHALWSLVRTSVLTALLLFHRALIRAERPGCDQEPVRAFDRSAPDGSSPGRR
jgi:hypothetical protein